jgi:hypothetical protein
MVVNLNTAVIYRGTVTIYCGILAIENIGTAVNFHGIFKTLAPGVNVAKLFSPSRSYSKIS